MGSEMCIRDRLNAVCQAKIPFGRPVFLDVSIPCYTCFSVWGRSVKESNRGLLSLASVWGRQGVFLLYYTCFSVWLRLGKRSKTVVSFFFRIECSLTRDARRLRSIFALIKFEVLVLVWVVVSPWVKTWRLIAYLMPTEVEGPSESSLYSLQQSRRYVAISPFSAIALPTSAHAILGAFYPSINSCRSASSFLGAKYL